MSKAKEREKAKANPGPEVPGRCNAIRRSGKRCRQNAGRGTPHVGVGPCKECAGSTPNVVKRYARLEAIRHARQFLDTEEEIGAFDSALINVRIGASMVRYQRAKLAALGDGEITAADEAAVVDALNVSQRMNQIAINAGIAERIVNIAERAGEQMALMVEAGFAAMLAAGAKVTNEQRAAFARAFALEGASLEDEAPPLRLLAPGADVRESA